MKHANLIVFLLAIIVVFILGVILLELRAILLPFVIAFLLTVIFKPLVLYFKARRVPVAVSLIVVLISFATIIFLLGLTLYSSIDPFVAQLPSYQVRFNSLIQNAMGLFEVTLAKLGIRPEELEWTSIFDFSSITPALTSGVGSFISFISNAVLVLLFMLFMLAGCGELGDKIKKALPENYSDRIANIIDNIDRQVRQYLLTKTLVSLATGTLTWLILVILGVDFPLVWGFVAFLLNFIPNIGSLIAVLFPFIWSLLQFDAMTRPLLLLLFLGMAQTVMGNIVEPKIMAFSFNLSPLFVLVSLIFWGWLWGIWGMILAVPLTATIKIIFENIEPLRPVSVLMSEKAT